MTVRRADAPSEDTRFVITERELDIMIVMWDRGPSTVSEVKERLAHELAYTTVLTLLRILTAKGYLTRQKEGRAHRYSFLVGREQAADDALRYLTRKLFRDSPVLLVSTLLSTHHLSEAEISQIGDHLRVG